MLATLAVGAVAALSVALASAQSPDPTLLVLQPADLPRYLTTGTAPQATSNDGPLSVSSTRYGRVSGAVASYMNVGGVSAGVGPTFLTSRAVILRNATGAHGAYLEVSANLGRSTGSDGSSVAVGQEARSFNVLVIGHQIVWRHGNVLGHIHATGGRGPGTSAMDYAPLQQARIAALVQPADPGPQVVVKPVIGKPSPQPALPKAGKSFAVKFKVTWSSDGTPVKNGSVASSTRVAGKAVPHRYSFSAGLVRLTTGVPKTAKGKQLKISLKVVADGQAATKVITYTVR